jgi:glycosyltransferase involved in cell wall biosynthesis
VRVAFLTPEIGSLYGWARYGMETGRELAAQGVEVIALVQPAAHLPADADWLAETLPMLPQLVPPASGFLPRSLLAVPRVRRALAGCDIVHVIAEPYAPLGAWTAGSRPLIVTAHGTFVPRTVRRRFAGRLYQWAYRRAHLIAVSEYTADQVRAVLPGVDPDVIHNGVHVARFRQPAPPPQKAGPTVLASGGIKPRKGTHILIEAMPRVRAAVPDVQLVITGYQEDTAYLSRVQQLIRQFHLESCVHLLGMIPEDELLSWYQYADVFVLPSLIVGGQFEGFGLVFLEAGACGLPVVGTSGSGIAEAIRDGETGFLVPQNDADALADAITRLLTDDALRAQMGAAGRQHAQNMDWSSITARVIAEYKKLLPPK